MFFRLLPEVYLTIGKKKSLLQNILYKKSLWINNDIASLLIKSEKNNKIEENFKIFETLHKDGWGILFEKPIFIDKLRLMNVFNDKKFFKSPPVIHSAILKLTNTCNLNCENCRTNFCPICFRSDIPENSNLSLEEMLTVGEVSFYPQLNSLYKYILNLESVNIKT